MGSLSGRRPRSTHISQQLGKLRGSARWNLNLFPDCHRTRRVHVRKERCRQRKAEPLEALYLQAGMEGACRQQVGPGELGGSRRMEAVSWLWAGTEGHGGSKLRSMMQILVVRRLKKSRELKEIDISFSRPMEDAERLRAHGEKSAAQRLRRRELGSSWL